MGQSEKGTKGSNDSSALCLCAFAPLCLHRCEKTKLKPWPRGWGFSRILGDQ